MSPVVARTWKHRIGATGIEKLSGHHHLLLLTRVRIRCLPLIHQVEQVRLVCSSILMADSARGTNSVVAHARCRSAESTGATGVSIMLCHHGHVILLALRREIVHRWCGMTCVALSQLGHEVAIEHSLPHLHLLLIATNFVGATVIAG